MPRMKLIAARKRERLSQEELAERLGVEKTTLQVWELGRPDPRSMHVRAVFNYFGIDDIDDFLEITEDTRPRGRSRLIAAREAKNLKQREIADLAELRRPAISEWETGAVDPSAHAQQELRKVLENDDPVLFALDATTVDQYWQDMQARSETEDNEHAETSQRRTKLIAARENKGWRGRGKLTQQMVADAIGYSREAYSMWERGIADPHEQAREALMQFFRVTDPADLDLGPSIAPAASLEITIHQLEPYSRHELISALQQLPALADVDV